MELGNIRKEMASTKMELLAAMNSVDKVSSVGADTVLQVRHLYVVFKLNLLWFPSLLGVYVFSFFDIPF